MVRRSVAVVVAALFFFSAAEATERPVVVTGAGEASLAGTLTMPDQALATRRPDDHLLVVVPDVGHPLKRVGGDLGDPIAPAILAALGPWLDHHWVLNPP